MLFTLNLTKTFDVILKLSASISSRMSNSLSLTINVSSSKDNTVKGKIKKLCCDFY